MFIGNETLDLAYNGGTFTNQITFRTVSGNLGFQFLRYQNRMIFKEVNKKVNMELFEIIDGSTTAEPKYKARSNWPLYQDIVDSIIEEKGLSLVIERKGATWYAYIKANGNYYKVCNVGGTNSFDYSATINAETAITSVELYAAGGASTSNPAYMKNVVVTLNPTDTITTVN
jgi:hypothetical protein